MNNKIIKASIDERQLNSPYAAIKEVQAQADLRMQRVIELIKQTRSSSEKTPEEKRRQ